MKSLSLQIKLSISIAVAYVLSFFLLYNLDNVWENGDSSGYYIHTVSSLLYGDIGSYEESTKAMIESQPGTQSLLDDPFWMKETELGRKYIKYSIGVGVMEIPGFLAAHLFAKLSKAHLANGWSQPYVLAINLSKVAYVLIGFYILIGILVKSFKATVVTLTVLGIALGTNLFFHIPNLTLAHPFLFFDFCMLIYFTTKFYSKPNLLNASMIGLFVGLITITRVPEVVCVSIPLLWGVFNKKTALERLIFLRNKYRLVFLALLVFCLILSPQIAYWKYVSGQFFFNPYEGEGFNFFKPKFKEAFLSFNNGWLTYTPLMLFSLLGLFALWLKFRGFFLPVVLFVGLNSWIHFSYYTVNYFPGLGCRPMIESYPLLAFPLAAFFSFTVKKRVSKIITISILLLCTLLNIFQTIQSQKGILFSQNMNPTYFREIFGRLSIDRNSVKEFDSNEDQPKAETLELEKSIYFQDFEEVDHPSISSELAFSGEHSFFCSDERPSLAFEGNLGAYNLKPDDFLSASIQVYRKEEDFVYSLYELEHLLVEIMDADGMTKRKRSIKMARFTNQSNSIFNLGSADVWGEAQFFVKIPSEAGTDWSFKVSVWNPSKKKIYVDDLRVEKYVLREK